MNLLELFIIDKIKYNTTKLRKVLVDISKKVLLSLNFTYKILKVFCLHMRTTKKNF